MWQEERFRRIRALVTAFGQVSAERVVAELGVSRETVRRDLVAMEKQGELQRVHGGVVGVSHQPSITVRVNTRTRDKRAIAQAAAARVTAGQTLFLDAGSTTAILAEELAKLSGLTIITNSFDVALRLNAHAEGSARANEVVVLGGTLRGALHATFGDGTVADIRRYRADVALLSPVGMDPAYGAMSYDLREAEVARAMAHHARQLFILADHSKIGLCSRVSYCDVARIDHLITDRKAAQREAYAALVGRVASVVVAG